MDYRDSDEERAFRNELRAWLTANAPAEPPPRDADARMAYNHRWHRALADGGWLGLSFPVEYGGQGRSLVYDAILNDELGAAGLPPAPAINHITNAIRLFGSEEQKRTHLPGLLSCRVLWCQGFSEPNAGSDLSSLRTRGRRATSADGTDVYVVDGQKIWTSEAVWAEWCLLLLRTEADVPEHRGLSMLMVPMRTPGIECRPIITSYGSSEFAELFLTGAEVPAANLLGAPGQGWTIAMQLLGFERGPADMGWTARLERTLTLLAARVRDGEIRVSAAQREALARAWVELQALKLHVQRSTGARLDGSAPGPEGSIDKLLMTNADQLLGHVVLDVLGAEAVLDDVAAFPGYVWSRAQSIFGGTQQIQRNIVAQRVLGLPRA
jgi:alkylation response protein AidB-like acyl-CoA dehydrogenase